MLHNQYHFEPRGRRVTVSNFKNIIASRAPENNLYHLICGFLRFWCDSDLETTPAQRMHTSRSLEGSRKRPIGYKSQEALM
jgi:hypothetical protein